MGNEIIPIKRLEALQIVQVTALLAVRKKLGFHRSNSCLWLGGSVLVLFTSG